MLKKIVYSTHKPTFKATKFPDEEWSYIAPRWEEVGQICLDLAVKIIESGKRFDILVTLAKGGWTWSRTIADILQIEEMASFKLTFYDPNQPGKRLENPVLETPLTVSLQGKDVLLFDDVDDTGESLRWSIDYLSFFNPLTVTTATLFHKPHSKFNPDFYGEETKAWVIFPHEKREGIVGLARKWREKGFSEEEIKGRLIEIGLPEKEIDLFLKLEKLV